MKTRALTICVFIGISIFLTGCERAWYLSIVDATNLEHPTICISTKPNCTGEAVDLSILAFDEIDKSGNTLRTAWVIQTSSNKPLRIVKYGTTPDSWISVKQAASIEAGKIYRVENHIFTCESGRPNNTCSVIQ